MRSNSSVSSIKSGIVLLSSIKVENHSIVSLSQLPSGKIEIFNISGQKIMSILHESGDEITSYNNLQKFNFYIVKHTSNTGTVSTHKFMIH